MTSPEQFVGLGPQRYRVDRPWGKLPPSLSYSGIADVTVMSSGRVAILLRSDPAVLAFDRDGGSATPTSSAAHATRGAPTNPELTLSLDHSSGAAHPRQQSVCI